MKAKRKVLEWDWNSLVVNSDKYLQKKFSALAVVLLFSTFFQIGGCWIFITVNFFNNKTVN